MTKTPHLALPMNQQLLLSLFFLVNIVLNVECSFGETKADNVTAEENSDACPKLNKGLPNIAVTVGEVVYFNIPKDAFTGNYSVIQLTVGSERSFPKWLFYNSTERLFDGTPKAQDVGTLEIHIVAGCEKCVESCANVTSSFKVIVQPEDSTVSEMQNRSPILMKPMGRLMVGLGQHFQIKIPSHTFVDAEDGGTRNLTLSIYHPSKVNLSRNFWLQLNVSSQTIYGIPLAKDYLAHPIELVLSATDTGGLVAKDTILVALDAMPLKDFSHDFVVTLDMEQSAFMASPDYLLSFINKMRRHYGDASTGSVSILSVKKGSVIVSWANNTLSKSYCEKQKIKQIYSKISDGQGGVNSGFFSSMLPEFYVSKVGFRFRGICVPSMVYPPDVTTQKAAVPKTHGMEWYEVVLPTLIVIFAILLILFVGVICCRRFRHRGKSVLRSEKDDFEDFGQPVMLPEEMELQDIDGKPCRPLVLATDPEEDLPELPPPDGKRVSQPQDYHPPADPGYDNGGYQPPPVYRIPPAYSSPGQSLA